MKVAIVTSGYLPVPASLGGAVECLDDYLIDENERQKKCNLTIFSAYDKKAEEIANTLKNTNVIFIKTPTILKLGDWLIYHFIKFVKPHSKTMSFRYILKRLHFINKVANILHQKDYDRVMIENNATLLMTLKKKENYKKYKGKYYYHLHNEQNKLYGCEQVLNDVKKILTVSNYISNTIKNNIPNLTDSQVEVWKNCVDAEKFRQNYSESEILEKKRNLDISDSEKVVLFTGRLSPEKGIKELLQAFTKINTSNVCLVIAGGYLFGDTKVKNSYEEELQILAQKVSSKIIFTGFIEHDELPLIYKMADIVVIPSIWNDPAPLTVIETITSGIPLITTNSGGIPEYASKDCSIILERDENLVDNLAKSIDSLLNNPSKSKEMTEMALQVSKNWNIPNYYNRFLECIEIK